MIQTTQKNNNDIEPKIVNKWSLELIREIEWKRFEILCKELLTYKNKNIIVALTNSGGDDGVDITLIHKEYKKLVSIAQCKSFYNKKVGVKYISEFTGVMLQKNIKKGYFMTSNEFTDEAISFAKSIDKLTIQLVTGVVIINIINNLPEDQQVKLLRKITRGDYKTPTCSSCDIKMVSRKGKNSEFWGCSHFPKCRITINKHYQKKLHVKNNIVMKQISTTALAKKLGIASKALFAYLLESGLIEKADKVWQLTTKGKHKGGDYKESKQYGKYIVWPEDINIEIVPQSPDNTQIPLVSTTTIGRQFELSPTKVNFILSELGWVKKGLKGWLITDQGKKQGGIQDEDNRSGVPYVRWPESITDAKSLKETVGHVKGTETVFSPVTQDIKEEVSFRDKFEAKHRSADGHFVRSKAEMLIDNWLYMAEIVHAYERKLPIEEDVYSDFYIPTGKVYIEYWGYENDPKYLVRKQKKIALYMKYGFNLIELQDKDVQNLDDILPRLLLKYGVQAY
ncbi:DNA topoisomerase I [Candidatus Venteria ishoeyi]|uniref:DNA topoisomerase I n=2 Tax=Candidatus Venteria ishoeyi TaxID=1899563 RepID=A0A1H6F4D0_9GAMM|nr:DNA topoisomerase I [Candidatus Venteria ishoeyi]